MLTKQDLITLLSPVVSNIYEDHISTNQVMNFPYIVILEMGTDNTFADNSTYHENMPINVILHQAQRDNTLESNIKNVFNTNHIPYQYDTNWDKDNLLYATTYSIIL